ncbi:MAG: alanine dehydrogenase [Mycoplasmataceae bacterium]|nr:alanine dehydrogenase [Mycoplasmataceae bacterium]
MKIGCPKEIKNNENRVGLTPDAVRMLVKAKNKVFMQKGAGKGSGFTDKEYALAGAELVDAKTAWDQPMIIKVKEPLHQEYKYFKPGMILFTYIHIADNKPLAEALLKKGVTAIAYETMVGNKVRLPLLAPMSRVAGRRASIVAATHLESHRGGMGLLPGGVDDNDPKKPTTEKGWFMVVGGGVVGYNAAFTAMGLGTNVVQFEANPKRITELKNDKRMKDLSKIFNNKYIVEASTAANIDKWISKVDAVISTVLIPGAKAPKVIKREMVSKMKPGSVIVDVAIDQGGSVETITHSTTHNDPVIVYKGVQQYAVANMPGTTSRTSTHALVAATAPYAVIIAKGLKIAIKDPTVYTGVNTYNGFLTNKPVAEALGIKFHELKELL